MQEYDEQKRPTDKPIPEQSLLPPVAANAAGAIAENAETSPPADKARPPIKAKKAKPVDQGQNQDNKVIRLLEKNPLGMTLPEMAGGPRQVKKIKLLRPMLAEAIKLGMVMPISQRAGATVYKLVKYLGPR